MSANSPLSTGRPSNNNSSSAVSSPASIMSYINPNMAWFGVFLPAFFYYMVTRLYAAGLFRTFNYGPTMTSTLEISSRINCPALQKVFTMQQHECPKLQHTLHAVEQNTHGIIASCWKFDVELGRGFILLSTAIGKGRIWRWEVGGGPIAIGRTLFVEDSGCRSNMYRNCTAELLLQTTKNNNNNEKNNNSIIFSSIASGGIAIENSSPDHFSEGQLLVAEWGEGRIVRMEQENGARTPIVLQVPTITSCGGIKLSMTVANSNSFNTVSALSSSSSTRTTIKPTRRVQQPFALLYTPFGDLLFLDKHDKCGTALWRLKQPHLIPNLQSLPESRQAHGWTHVGNNMTESLQYLPDLLLDASQLGGISLTTSWVNVYVTAKHKDQIVLLQIPIDDDDDNDIDNNHIQDETNNKKILLDYSMYTTTPGAVTVDNSGHVFLSVNDGVLITNNRHEVLGKLPLPDMPTTLTIGDDNFLYITTLNALYRIKLKTKPLSVPTNLVVKNKKV